MQTFSAFSAFSWGNYSKVIGFLGFLDFLFGKGFSGQEWFQLIRGLSFYGKGVN